MSQKYEFEQSLYYNYQLFKEESLKNRFFKHNDIKELIARLGNNKLFSVNEAGKSVEGREIYLISVGNGKKKIFLWSQMHGDEPTATMALFDIMNFFADSINYKEIKNEILSKTKIYFLPMVNPDGAELFKRRNILSIDLNRDANRLQTPEAITLMKVFDSLKADFGFNLHDQNHRYTAGNTFKSATISFLAPPINYDKEKNQVRIRAIKLIGGLYEMLNDFIPGHIAKYSDDYEPRAFGDNFQKKGTSTILVESGGWQNDPEKQFIRKLNFILLLSAFKQIAENSYETVQDSVYESIPFNEEKLFDVLLRNLSYNKNGKKIKLDIGINFEEILTNDKKSTYRKATIEDIGDLSVFYGYTDIDLSGYEIFDSKTFTNKIFTGKDIERLNLSDFHSKGYTNIYFKGHNNSGFTNLPINLILDKNRTIKNSIEPGSSANFVLKKNGKTHYVVVNGFILDINRISDFTGNGLIFD